MKRVLILDDDMGAANQLASRLGALGFHAAAAPSALEAVEQLQDGGVAVLVAGQRAGGRPGVDMIRLAREVSPGTRSLLVGAEATAREYKVALEQGAVEVLTCPYSERDLVHAVRKALECGQGFHGSIHGLSLIDLLQMVHLGRRSLVIRLGLDGAIHMFEGEIVHAVAPPLFGREALLRMLALRSGSLATSPFERCARTVDTPFEVLLLDVLCQLDEERSRSAEDRAFLEALPTVESPPLPPPLAIRPPRRGRLLVAMAVALLGALAALALLLFLLAPGERGSVVRPSVGQPTRWQPPSPVSEPLAPAEPPPLEAPGEVTPAPKTRNRPAASRPKAIVHDAAPPSKLPRNAF